MSATSQAVTARVLPTPSYVVGRILHQKYLTYKNSWIAFLTGFLEPVFYLFSIGVGVGKLIESFGFGGHTIGYAEFVAPASTRPSTSTTTSSSTRSSRSGSPRR
jgi:hypothetical protein